VQLPPEHLEYPHRHRGMDHDRYDWSPLGARPAVHWPNGARLALWVVIALEWFPLDTPPEATWIPGALDGPYPDFRSYTHRDYGNRVGFFRLLRVVDQWAVRTTAAVNAAVCMRYPALLSAGLARNWEFIGYGVNMARPHTGLNASDEAQVIEEALETIRQATGEKVRGWLSPGGAESSSTPDLLSARGIQYVCDWVNDDLPYRFRTAHAPLYAMPYGHEISDTTLIWQAHHSPQEYAEQVIARFDWLYREAAHAGGRILALSLHPWVIGQPHRINALAAVFAHIHRHADIWSATGTEILTAFRAQNRGGE
jgi:peptidoglycan/xylan/chitin deacetylase (PgdA/CDA1 family)